MKFTLFAVLSMTSQVVLSQYPIDSVSQQGDLTKWYDKHIGLENTILHHAEVAKLSRKSPNSHAYYNDNSWVKADITYCSQKFRNISALYNIEDDVLIISNELSPTYTAFPMKLQKELVSSFQIGDSHFEFIREPVSWHENSFYKVAFRGESITLLSKVFKRPELKDGIFTYIQFHHYFLKKDGKYYRLKRLSHLLKLFPDHKKEIRQYKKQLALRKLDKPSNEKKLVQLISYCESLN